MADPDETLFEGRWLRLHRQGRWEMVSRLGRRAAVVIVAVDRANRLILVEQERPTFAPARTLELPAGLVDDGESAVDAARRELFEETGYVASSLVEVVEGCVSPGLTTERIVVIRARDVERAGPGGGVDGEEIATVLVPVADAERELARHRDRGVILDLKIWAGLAIARGP
jgi:ADP-ribose pyrophosphatase